MALRDLDTLKLINHVGVVRTNMLQAFHGGSAQNRRRELAVLRDELDLIYRPLQYRLVTGLGDRRAKSAPFVHALSLKGKKFLKDNGITPSDTLDLKNAWHELMVSDIVLSVATACQKNKLRFRFQHEIIDEPLVFPCTVEHDFPNHKEKHTGQLKPDYLFAINDTYFVLEADRSTETTNPTSLKHKSFLRNLLQYREVIKTKSYQTLIPNIIVLNVFLSHDRALNVMNYMYGELDMMSRSVCFTAYPELKLDPDTYPQPITKILNHRMARAGYADTTMLELITERR